VPHLLEGDPVVAVVGQVLHLGLEVGARDPQLRLGGARLGRVDQVVHQDGDRGGGVLLSGGSGRGRRRRRALLGGRAVGRLGRALGVAAASSPAPRGG